MRAESKFCGILSYFDGREVEIHAARAVSPRSIFRASSPLSWISAASQSRSPVGRCGHRQSRRSPQDCAGSTRWQSRRCCAVTVADGAKRLDQPQVSGEQRFWKFALPFRQSSLGMDAIRSRVIAPVSIPEPWASKRSRQSSDSMHKEARSLRHPSPEANTVAAGKRLAPFLRAFHLFRTEVRDANVADLSFGFEHCKAQLLLRSSPRRGLGSALPGKASESDTGRLHRFRAA